MKEVFTAGLLKPGLNYEAGEKKEVKNNIPAMKQKLAGATCPQVGLGKTHGTISAVQMDFVQIAFQPQPVLIT